MILVDANLLLYGYNESSRHHTTARRWLEAMFSGPEPVGLAWLTISAFLRISTNPRAFERPLSQEEAIRIVEDWLIYPAVLVPEPGERYWPILKNLLEQGQAQGPLVMDACLAALAIEHGLVLCTNDKDFSRFPGLRVRNPLESD